MTSAENLLVVAGEEAAELVQALDKMLRFGPTGHHPDTPEETNEFNVMKEWYQLVAMIEMLKDCSILHSIPIWQEVEIKTSKREAVAKYLQISKDIGTITE